MSSRALAVACALLLYGSACSGGRFDPINANTDGAAGHDAEPPDTTPPEAGEDGSDGGTDDVAPSDARDVGIDGRTYDSPGPEASEDGRIDASQDAAVPDMRPSDSSPIDSSPVDSSDMGTIIDGALVPDRAAGDVLSDGLPNEAGADAGAMPWCMGKQFAFCADFDTVVAWSDGWTTANVTPGAVLDFNLVDFTSPRRSLRAKIPASGGMNLASARLTKIVPTTLSRSVLDFDCNVASIGAGSGQWLLPIARVGRNVPDNGVALLAQDMGRWAVFVTTDAPVLLAELPAPPPYGRFVHVTIDVVWSVTAGSVNVLFDGVTVFSRDAIATALGPTTSSVDVVVGVGAAAGADAPPAEISFDNVALQQR